MPLYEYECEAAHHRFEVIQKFSDPPVQTCPTCGSPVHKLVAAPAFQLKGTGWYITDYAKKDSGGSAAGKSSAPAEKEAAPAAESKSEKTDSTPAPAPTSTDKTS